jgi:hypothetical protein
LGPAAAPTQNDTPRWFCLPPTQTTFLMVPCFHVSPVHFMKKLLLPIFILCFGIGLRLPALGQQAPAAGTVYTKTLPEDLPTAKLLFVKFRPAPVPTERPKNMPASMFLGLQQHAVNYSRANEQLLKSAALYPFAYRITTQDSTSYYYERGYKYVLFNQSFNAFTGGYFKNTDVTTPAVVDLYIQDLASRDKYIIDSFNEPSVYSYKMLVGMLLKRVEKQFNAKK